MSAFANLFRTHLIAGLLPLVVAAGGLLMPLGSVRGEQDYRAKFVDTKDEAEFSKLDSIPKPETFRQIRDKLMSVQPVVEALQKEADQELKLFLQSTPPRTPEAKEAAVLEKRQLEQRKSDLSISLLMVQGEIENCDRLAAELKDKSNFDREAQANVYQLVRSTSHFLERYTTSVAQYRIVDKARSLSWNLDYDRRRLDSDSKAQEEQVKSLEESRNTTSRDLALHYIDMQLIPRLLETCELELAACHKLLATAERGQKVRYFEDTLDAAGMEKIVADKTEFLRSNREWLVTSKTTLAALKKELAERETAAKEADTQQSKKWDDAVRAHEAWRAAQNLAKDVSRMTKTQFEAEQTKLQEQIRLLESARPTLKASEK